jgi:phage terminase large subunit
MAALALPRSELVAPKLRDLFFRPGPKGRPIYIPSRYKIAHGGRGSAKSWGFGRVGVQLAAHHPVRVLCVRELQNSIQESIHKLLSNQTEIMGLSNHFEVQNQGIYGRNGSEFIFAGIKSDPGKIKSLEGVDICLVEEAEKVSEASWRVLLPTIRKTGSEIWVCFNSRESTDATYKRFVVETPPDSRRVWINYDDNPWFPEALELERQYSLDRITNAVDDDDRAQAQADYDHIWLGHCQKNSNATIFRKRVVVEAFDEPPERTRIHFGADWGFAADPTALVRFWITEKEKGQQHLWISHEAFGHGVEIDETPALFDTLPGSRKWPIKADCARPETISYVARKGFSITAAEKWAGSLEDGIAHVKGFERIHIHPRCKHMQDEARLYSYKVDKISGDILPIVVDRHNHGWDAVRYGLDGYIQRRGIAAQWARLGKS